MDQQRAIKDGRASSEDHFLLRTVSNDLSIPVSVNVSSHTFAETLGLIRQPKIADAFNASTVRIAEACEEARCCLGSFDSTTRGEDLAIIEPQEGQSNESQGCFPNSLRDASEYASKESYTAMPRTLTIQSGPLRKSAKSRNKQKERKPRRTRPKPTGVSKNHKSTKRVFTTAKTSACEKKTDRNANDSVHPTRSHDVEISGEGQTLSNREPNVKEDHVPAKATLFVSEVFSPKEGLNRPSSIEKADEGIVQSMTTRSTHIALPGHSPVTSTPDLRTAGHSTEVKPNTAGISSDDESRNIPQTPAHSSPLILERAPHRNTMQSHEGLSSQLSKTIEAREGQNELMAQRPKKVLRGKSMKRIGVLKGRNTTPSTSLRQRKPGTRQPGEQASGINGSRLQQLFDLPQDSTPATQAASASRHAEHPLSSRRMCTGSAARTLRPATNSPSVNYQSVVPNFFVYNVAGSERREAQHLHVHNYRQAGNRCCERYQQGPMQYPPALSGVQDASTYITTVAAQNLAATPQGSTSTTHNVVYFQSQDVWHFTAYKEPTNYCSAIPAVQASAYIPSTAARDQSLARAVQAPVLYTVSDPNEFMFHITPPSANMHPNSVVPHDRNMPNMNSAQTRVCQGDQGFDSVPNGSSIPALRQSQSTHQDEKIKSRSHPS